MYEQRLKNMILFLMLTAKIGTIGAILFHYFTDGLMQTEMVSALTLVIPLFTVYLSVILKDILSDPYRKTEKTQPKPKTKIKSGIAWLAMVVFPIYFIAVLTAINQTARGNMDSNDLQTAIGIIESAFGVYLGQIIFALFKKKPNNVENEVVG